MSEKTMTLWNLTEDNGLLTDGDWVESKDQDPNGVISLIQLADVKDGYFQRKSDRYLNEKTAKRLNCTFLKEGDVLVARLPDPLGRACIYPGDDHEAVTAVDVCIIRIDRTKYNNRWLTHLINNPHFRKEINKFQSGTTRKRISKKNLAAIPFAVPEKKVQDAITDCIEALFTRLDVAIRSLKSVKAKLEFYRKSILKAAFEGSLVKFDLTEDKLIGEFCEKVRQIKPENESFKDFLYIDIGSIDNKNQKIDSPKVVESKKAPSRARQETFAGDIVYSTVRVYLMNVAIVPDLGDKRIVSSTGFTVLRPNEKLSSKFLFYRLLSDDVTRYLSGKQRGTSYPAIRDNDLFDMKITVPSRQVQDKIVQEIESRFSVIDKAKRVVNDSIVKSETLRKSILKTAFEGKLVN